MISDELIGRISQRLGLDFKYFAKTGSLVTARYVIIALLSLGTSVAFARLTNPELYGRYQYILTIISFFSIITLPGLNFAALRDTVAGKPGSIKAAFRLSFLASLLAVVAVFMYAVSQHSLADPLIRWPLVIATVSMPFFYAPNQWYVYYEARQDFFASTWRLILQSVVLTASQIIVLIFHAKLYQLILIFVTAGSVFNLFYYWEAAKQIPAKYPSIIDIKYGISSTIQKFFSGLSDTLHPLVVSLAFGFHFLAFYQVAIIFITAFSTFFVNLSTIYFPRLLKTKKLPHLTICLYHLVLGLVSLLVYGLFLKLFFLRLYGTTYQPSLVVAQLLYPVVIILPLKTYLINYFSLAKKNQLVIGSAILANIVALGIFFLLKSDFVIRVSTFYISFHLTYLLVLLGLFVRHLRHFGNSSLAQL